MHATLILVLTRSHAYQKPFQHDDKKLVYLGREWVTVLKETCQELYSLFL